MKLISLVSMSVALLLSTPWSVRGQKFPKLPLPPAVDLEIPLTPTPVKCNGKVCLVYELHVTNFQTNDLELLRLEVLPDDPDYLSLYGHRFV